MSASIKSYYPFKDPSYCIKYKIHLDLLSERNIFAVVFYSNCFGTCEYNNINLFNQCVDLLFISFPKCRILLEIKAMLMMIRLLFRRNLVVNYLYPFKIKRLTVNPLINAWGVYLKFSIWRGCLLEGSINKGAFIQKFHF